MSFEALEDRTVLASVELFGAPPWVEQGPGPITNDGVMGMEDQSNPVVGAIQSIAVHPSNPNTVYVGTVNGGIWRTLDADTSEPLWVPLTDQYPSLAIGAIAFSPLSDPTPDDPNDDVLYAGTGSFSSARRGGGAGVGVLKTTDGGQSWSVLGESEFDGLRITSIVPTRIGTNADNQVVLVAATEFVRHVAAAGAFHTSSRGGIYRSLDGGVHWQRLSGTDGSNLPLGPASHLVADPSNPDRFYAAIAGNFDVNNDGINNDDVPWENKGIYRSDDVGQTWSKVSGAISLFQDSNWDDANHNGICDAGDTGDDDQNGACDEPAEGMKLSTRIKLAVSDASPQPLYAAIVNTAENTSTRRGRIAGIFRSSNAGDNWTTMEPPGTAEGDPHPGEQAELHLSLVADPGDAQLIFVGGDRQPRGRGPDGTLGTDDDAFPNSAGCTASVGNILRADASMAFGAQWRTAVCNEAHGSAPHADSRDMVFVRNGGESYILEADDGGIYRLNSPNDRTSARWVSRNGNLAITEVHSIAYDPVNDVIISGNQDTGSTEQLGADDPRWAAPFVGTLDGEQIFLRGDGFVQAVDASDPHRVLRYSMQNNFRSFYRRAFDGPVQLDDDPTDPALARHILLARSKTPNTHLSGLTAEDRHVSVGKIPYVLNDLEPQRMLLGFHGLYESSNAGAIIHTRQAGRGLDEISALAYGGLNSDGSRNVGLIYAARGNTIFVRPGTGQQFHSFNIPGATAISDIEPDPTNWRIAYAVDSMGVYFTTDGGMTWSRLGGNLPVRNAQALELVKTAGADLLLVGGLGGVFRAVVPDLSDFFGDAAWTEFGRRLPNVLVTDLAYEPRNLADPADDVLIAGTLGRGTWKITNVLSELTQPELGTLRITGEGTSETILLQRNEKNPSILEIEVNGVPLVDPNGPFQLSTMKRIEISGSGGDDTLIVDSTSGVIDVAEHIHYHAGLDSGAGARDQLVVQGRGTTPGEPTDGLVPDASGSVFVADDDGVQVVVYENLETLHNLVRSPLHDNASLSSAARSGLKRLADWSRQLNSPTLLARQIPFIGESLGRVLNGLILSQERPFRDPAPADAPGEQVGEAGEEEAVPVEPSDEAGSDIVRRIIETGLGAFPLKEIGRSIDTPAELAEMLDGLDQIDGNVGPPTTLSDGTTRFDVHVMNKVISGTADLDVNAEALGGTIALTGSLEITAAVDLHIIFGVDAQGFFIDADGNPDPELVELIIHDIQISGDVSGVGRFGFLEVTLADDPPPQLTFDSQVKLAVDLREPGPDPISGEMDNLIRPDELDAAIETFAVANLSGNATANDVVFTGTFEVAALAPDLGPAINLGGAQVTLTWPDINEPHNVVPTAAVASSGADLIQFLQVSSDEIFTALADLSHRLQQAQTLSLGVLGTQIPLVSASLSGILGGEPNDLIVESAPTDPNSIPLLDVSEVFEDEGVSKFTVAVLNTNLTTKNLAAGDTVRYRGAGCGDACAGTIDRVDPTEFTVRFSTTLTQPPDVASPRLVITRSGSLERQIASVLGSLNEFSTFQVSIPTLQSLVRELADRAGISLEDIALNTTISGGGDLIVEIAPTIELDPLTFRHDLDLGTTIGGLELAASGDFTFSIKPELYLPLGLNVAERQFFLVADAELGQPSLSLSLAVQANLDNVDLEGTIGFLNVALREEDPASDGVTISGSVTIKLTDPSGGNRITLDELTSAGLDVGLGDDGIDFQIDPLILSATVGSSTELSTLRISLSGSDGHVTSADALGDIPGRITFEGDLAGFSSFDNLTPQMILLALQQLIDHLSDLGAGAVFQTRLPVINKSLSELVDLGQTLNNKLGALNETATAQDLQAFLQSKLGGTVQVTVNPDDIRFSFRYTACPLPPDCLPLSLPFSIDLGGALGAFVNVSGGGELQLNANASFNVTVGIATTPPGDDIAADIASRVFLDTAADNELEITATANAGYDLDDPDDLPDTPPINFTLGIGGFTIDVVNGRGLIVMALTADLTGPDDRVTLANIADGTFEMNGNFTGRVQALLPLDGPDADPDPEQRVAENPDDLAAGDAIIEIAGKLENLPNGIEFSDPGLHSNIDKPLSDSDLNALGSHILVFNHNLDGLVTELFNFDDLIGGLNTLLTILQSTLSSDLGKRLPLVGNRLPDAAGFVGDIRSFVDKLGAELGSVSSDQAKATLVQDLLLDVLGQKVKPPGCPADRRHDFDGLELIQDITGDHCVDTNDVILGTSDLDSNGTIDQYQYNLELQKTVPFGGEDEDTFDIGLDALDLSVEGGFTGTVKFDWKLGFGINSIHGFYLDTSSPFPELTIGLNVATPDLAASGRLGFLQLHVTDAVPASGTDCDRAAPGDPRPSTCPTLLDGSFSINIKDPSGDNDKLTSGEIGVATLSEVFDARLTADADVNLKTKVSFADFGPEATFPTISADFHMHWGFDSAATTAADESFGNLPTVEFNNVQVELGTFFSHFIDPVLERIRDVLGPAEPAIDILTNRIPILSDIGAVVDALDHDAGGTPGHGAVSLLDIVRTASDLCNCGTLSLDFLSVLSSVLDITVPADRDAVVNLGSFNLGRIDVRKPTTDLSTIQLSEHADDVTDLDQLDADENSFVTGLQSLAGDGLQLPILTKPATAFKLLLGQDVPLVTFDMPTLEINVPVKTPDLRFGPIFGRLEGEFGARAHFAFGYDTAGIRAFANDPRENDDPGKLKLLLNGFYVSDTDNADGTGTNDVNEIELSATIKVIGGAGGTVGAGGISFGAEIVAEGGITGTLGVDLRKPSDPSDGGRVRACDLITRFPTCLFEGGAKVTFDARIFTKECFIFCTEQTWFDMPDIDLGSFTISPNCDAEPPVLATFVDPFNIAHEMASDELRLNMGPFAARREHVTDVIDELFRIRHKSGTAGNETILVNAFGIEQEYTGVRHIVADGGDGQDQITIESDVLATVEFWGGPGDDLLVAGHGDALLHGDGGMMPGDPGNDVLVGGPGTDVLYGDGNDRTFIGASNNDKLFGGSNDDRLFGGSNDPSLDVTQDGADILYGGDGADELHGGPGNDQLFGEAGSDRLFGDGDRDELLGGEDADELHGGDGSDLLIGGPNDDVLDGGPDNDALTGEDGRDLLQGGPGNDTQSGGPGNDVLRDDLGRDSLLGDDGDDDLSGGSENDFLNGGIAFDTIHGGTGNDTVLGGEGDDVLHGDAGNDQISGNVGFDQIWGEEGNDKLAGDDGFIPGVVVTFGVPNKNDIIYGGPGNDIILGEAGRDELRGGSGQDEVFGGVGTDLMFGAGNPSCVIDSTDNDELDGGPDPDTIYGDEGSACLENGVADTIHGGGGDDQLFGQGGNDEIYGDPGADHIEGNRDGDLIKGGDDNDSIFGNDGDDHIFGNAGDDSIVGGAGDDIVMGDIDDDECFAPTPEACPGPSGNDTVYGQGGRDEIHGNGGEDLIFGDYGEAGLIIILDGPPAPDSLFGDGGMDTVYGDQENDWIEGGSDDDELLGNTGNDTVYGDASDPLIDASGRDHIHGNDGNDSLFGGPGLDAIHGDAGRDTAYGGDDADVIYGEAGVDSLFGDAGADRIYGGDDGDTVDGGADDDFVYGEAGSDSLLGGNANDQLDGGDGNDSLDGGFGDDLLIAGTGFFNLLHGGPNDDRLIGADDGGNQPSLLAAVAGDSLFGDGGHDSIWGLGGIDSIFGGDGNDLIDGGAGADSIRGDAGDDLIFAGVGGVGDRIFGDADNDLIYGSDEGGDIIHGGNGNDRIFGQGGNDHIWGDEIGDETAIPGDDSLDGGTGTDTVLGGAGYDVLLGGGGAGDSLDAGEGDDIVYGSPDGGDSILAGPGRDRIDSAGGNDTVYGGEDDDLVDGGPGDDSIIGGLGRDLLVGGAQHDRLVGHGATSPGLIYPDDHAVDYIYGDFGSNGNELGSGCDRIVGGDGNDVLFGEGQADTIDPGGGSSNLVDDLAAGPGASKCKRTPAPPLATASGISWALASLPTGVDYRGRWSEFASSATARGLSGDAGLSIEPSIVANSMAGQYVAWADSRNGNYEVYVTRHTAGGGWQELASSAHGGGVSATLGSSRRPSIALNASQQPIVAWTEFRGAAPSTDINVARFDPAAAGGTGSWVAMGSSLSTGGISGTGAADHAVVTYANVGPIVAWLDSSSGTTQVHAKRFDGSKWVPVCRDVSRNGGVSSSATSVADMAIATDGNQIAVSWAQDVSGVKQIYLRVCVPAGPGSTPSWTELSGSVTAGGVSNTPGDSRAPTLAYFGSRLFVAWQDMTSGHWEIDAKRQLGTAWEPAGPGATTGGGLSNTVGQAATPQLASGGGGLFLLWTDDLIQSRRGDTVALYAKRWNGSAFVDELPGDASYGGISVTGGAVRSLALSVDQAGHPFVAWTDAASGTPEVYVRGNLFDVGTRYYVNDRSLDGDVVTRAVGSAMNDGHSPATPAAAIQQVLEAHDLGPGDVILVDSGTYVDDEGTANITADDAGVYVLGSPSFQTKFHETVRVDGAAGVTLDRLALFGGVSATSSNNLTIVSTSIGRSGLVIDGGAAAQVVHNLFGVVTDCVEIARPPVQLGRAFPPTRFTCVGQDFAISNIEVPTFRLNLALSLEDLPSAIELTGGAASSVVEHNLIGIGTSENGGRVGVTVTGAASNIELRDNAIRQGAIPATGISLAAPASGHISDNIVLARRPGGIANLPAVEGVNGLTITAPFGGLIENNDISGAFNGVGYAAAAALSRNLIHNNVIGVAATTEDEPNGLGFVGATQPNQIYENSSGVLAGLDAAADHLTNPVWLQNQHIFQNATGVTGAGVVGGHDFEHANVIEANLVGVDASGPIQFNRIAGNRAGISARSGQLITHNLVYRNTVCPTCAAPLPAGVTAAAVSINGRSDVQLINNTFYSPAGDNVHVENSSSNIAVQNNILWAASGYDLYVADDSHGGFASDHNDLYSSGSGALAYWNRNFNDLLDWRAQTGFDVKSIGRTVLSPTWAEPRFMSRSWNDYRVFNLVARQRFSSPTLDAGNAGADLGSEPTTTNVQHIALRYPDLRAELPRSRAHVIRWDSFNNVAHAMVRIELYQDDPVHGPAKWCVLSDGTADAGQFTWTPNSPPASSMPCTIPTSGLDGLRIQLTAVGNQTVLDRSTEPFRVLPIAVFHVMSTRDLGHDSLRQAIIEANATAGTDLIELGAGTFTLSIAGASEDAARTGDLDITDDLVIVGAGRDQTTIDARGIDRVFHVLSGIKLDVSSLTITGGNAAGSTFGGGILNAGGVVTVTNSVITSNVSGSSGGGIYNSGALTVTNSTISDNAGYHAGGGIRNAGTLTIMASTISGNSALGPSGDGGGIYNDGGATANMINCTVSGNTVIDSGAGVRNNGTLTLTHITITKNSGFFGAVYAFSGTTTIKNTIIAGNSGTTQRDVSGNFTSAGHNLIGSSSGGAGFNSSDLLGYDPKVGPLEDNGGPTFTHALLSGSPAIDSGDGVGAPATDQRGISRPQDGDANGVAIVDIGAYERSIAAAAAVRSNTGERPSPASLQHAVAALRNRSASRGTDSLTRPASAGKRSLAKKGVSNLAGVAQRKPIDLLPAKPLVARSGLEAAQQHAIDAVLAELDFRPNTTGPAWLRSTFQVKPPDLKQPIRTH